MGGLFLKSLTKYLYVTAYFQNDQVLLRGETFPWRLCLNLGKELEDLMMEKVINTRLQQDLYSLLSLFFEIQ